jgi:hypothetical protein
VTQKEPFGVVLLSMALEIPLRNDAYLRFTNRPAATPSFFGGLDVRESLDIESIVFLALEPDHESKSPPLPGGLLLLGLPGLIQTWSLA